MKIIGITGGVGSGKSRVLSYMETKYSAVICQADHVAWKLQEPGQKCYAQIVAYFGENILEEDGTINRGKLGQIVFNDKEKLDILQSIITNKVVENIDNNISRLKEERFEGIVIIDAAQAMAHSSDILRGVEPDVICFSAHKLNNHS